ncbi:MAG: hypothetical protein ACM3O8_03720 [Methylococcaceae bacterium]|nr:hypothetical protein [Prolixibacteraceae bacterium]
MKRGYKPHIPNEEGLQTPCPHRWFATPLSQGFFRPGARLPCWHLVFGQG